MAAVPDAGIEDYLATVAVARLVLGPGMRIQAPPNLVSRDECLALVGAGVDDWGGVSPLTPDHVNPERPWPALDELAAVTAQAGYELVQRLTAQPKYVQAGAAWIDPRVRGHVVALADPATGLARDVNPVGPALAGARRRGVLRPGRPPRGDRHRRPQHRSPQRSRQCVRRLGIDPRARARTGRQALRSASTPMCLPRCGRPNAIPHAAPTTSTWRWRPPTVPRWKPLPHWLIRCAATRSATT